MFIESLRRAKKKWRVGIGILLGLIVISLLATFSYAGNSVNVSSASNDGGLLASAETYAENAATAADNAAEDMTVQGEAASAYLSLAGYMELYLEDPADAYKEALVYAENMVSACGSVEEPDYDTAYDYLLRAQAGVGDAAALSTAFNNSLKVVNLSETYLNSYFNMMTALGAEEQFITDMDAVKAVLEPLATEEEPAAEEETEAADDEEKTETAEDEETTPSELMDYAAELARQATVAQESAE